MLKDLFYNRYGQLILTRAGTAAEEARWEAIVGCFLCRCGSPDESEAVPRRSGPCKNCPYRSGPAGDLISRVNAWIGSSRFAEEEVDRVFKGKTGVELGAVLHRRNNTLPTECRIDRITLISWRNASRDPSRRPNDKRSRSNVYKLCSLLGLRSKASVTEFFVSVVHAEAFTRLNELECCIEHFLNKHDRDWLLHAVKTEALMLGLSEAIEADDDEISIVSAIENSDLTEDEFAGALASYSAMKAKMHEARQAAEKLGRSVWLRINNKTADELPADWTIKNKKIISPILRGNGSEDAEGSIKASEVWDLAAIGAARNFPSARILNRIASGSANEEMIRRAIVLLSFAEAFFDPLTSLADSFVGSTDLPFVLSGSYSRSKEKLVNDFISECNNCLERCALRALDVSDGFDALILFCLSTSNPIASLRRRLRSGTHGPGG